MGKGEVIFIYHGGTKVSLKKNEQQETKCKRLCYNSYTTLTQLQESLIYKKINAFMTEEWLHERFEL